MESDIKIIKCIWCGKETEHTDSNECHRCWELKTFIQIKGLKVTKKIIKAIEGGKV